MNDKTSWAWPTCDQEGEKIISNTDVPQDIALLSTPRC